MATKIQIRRDSAANWTSINPVLSQGELGAETDTLKVKVGDGITAWNSIGYVGGSGDVTLTGTQTLTNKTFTDSTTTFQDDADNTKKFKFQVSGVTAGQTRTITIPDVDTTIVGTGANTWAGNQTGGDYQLVQWAMKDTGMVYFDKGTVSSGTSTLNYTDGSHQRLQVGGALTIALSNPPPSGVLGQWLLELVNGASATITWPTINWIKSDGTTTTSFASNGVTLQTSGTDWVLLWTRDGGTTVYGKVVR